MSKHRFEPKRRVMEQNGVKVTFRPYEADDYLHAFVKGDPDDPDADKWNMDIYVEYDGKETWYHYAVEDISASKYEQFVTKFLTNPSCRKELLVDGDNWAGVFRIEKKMIHPRCEGLVRKIESMKEEKLRFRDFASLKTFGQDGYSRKKIPELEEFLGEEKVWKIKEDERMEDEALYVSALRWMARGLSPNHAIRKVMTDREIAENANRR